MSLPSFLLSRRLLGRVARSRVFSGTTLKRPSNLTSRPIHLTATVRNTPSAPAIVEQDAIVETQSISELDGLLRKVREDVDPSQYQAIPVRNPPPYTSRPRAPSPSHTPPWSSVSKTLAPRRMQDSYSEITLPFASNPALLEDYINPSGGLRTGLLMEHLDSLAGSISYKHLLEPGNESTDPVQNGFYIVTAACDRLDMLTLPPAPARDMRLSGHIIAVGRSSMEVAVKVESLEPDQTLLLGRFSMVCRDAFTHKARAVNPLVLESAEEHALNAIGEAHRAKRQSLALRSLSRVPPTSAEAAKLHQLNLMYGAERTSETLLQTGEERVWMGDTKLEISAVMFPQQRNIHGKVFGGYLMRLAYELSYTSASLFTREEVRFLSLDKIAFAKPVPIGSILRLTAHVLHTTSTAKFPILLHIGVQADVVDVKTGATQTTNDFRFTWGRESAEPITRMVIPRTYQESMLWLEARRALELNTLLGQYRE